METLVVAEHRNQYYGQVKTYEPGQPGTSPKTFREINCRTFQSGMGILPTPYRAYSSPITKRASHFSSPSSPRSPSPTANPLSVDKTPLKASGKSSPIPITSNNTKTKKHSDERLIVESRSLSYSELWAGPTYSNSPPPSSVPMPKFPLRPKRTISLDLPAFEPSIEFLPAAKSAPASPSREHNPSTKDLLLCAESATQTLRRILNLDVVDE